MKIILKKISFIFLLIGSISANAWWETGHQTVCAEAYKLLSPKTLKSINPLIEGSGSLARGCLWADLIKKERRETGIWHYINLPDAEQNTFNTTCPKNGCLIDALYKQLAVLKNTKNSFQSKQEALLFIGHFVGDIHQPMHVGYPEDLGGNRHLLEFIDGRKTNMHKVWDGQIIEHMELVLGSEFFNKRVQTTILELLPLNPSSQIEVWAQESRDLAMADSVGYRGNTLQLVTDEYMEKHFEIVQERIALAAIRLSLILNGIFQEQS